MMLQQQTAASETAAVVLEPVLGEGGYVPPAPGLLPEAESMSELQRNKILKEF